MSPVSSKDAMDAYVGRVSPIELSFRGHDIRNLLGHSYWQLVSLSVGGPKLDSGACQLLDHLTTCMMASDPGIGLLRLIQLAACHGRVSTGVAAGTIATGPSVLSYWNAGAAAKGLRELKLQLGDQPLERVGAIWSSRKAPSGFGDVGRDSDQRVTFFREWRARSGTDPGPYEALAAELEKVTLERCGNCLRIDGLVGAVLSDIGFSPEQVAPVAGVVLALPMILANAYEGSQRGRSLSQLPRREMRYTGEEPRRSVRSQKAREPVARLARAAKLRA